MTKLEAIAASKTFRRDADELLQRMKAHGKSLAISLYQNQDCTQEQMQDDNEAISQHALSVHDLESCIMRQGMVLKYTSNPDPYPESRNPESTVVEPTADGLKL